MMFYSSFEPLVSLREISEDYLKYSYPLCFTGDKSINSVNSLWGNIRIAKFRLMFLDAVLQSL